MIHKPVSAWCTFGHDDNGVLQSPLEALKLAAAGAPEALTKPRIVSAIEHHLFPGGAATHYSVDIRVPEDPRLRLSMDLWLDASALVNTGCAKAAAIELAAGTPQWSGTVCIGNPNGADTCVPFAVKHSLLMMYAGALDALQDEPRKAALFVVRVMLGLH